MTGFLLISHENDMNHKSIANAYMEILEAAGVKYDGHFDQADTQL